MSNNNPIANINSDNQVLAIRGIVTIIAGPCAVESDEQMNDVCKCVKSLGLNWVRGGAYKPRSNVHSFQGLGKNGLKILSSTAHNMGLKCLSEATSSETLPNVLQYCDAVQIGTRNMSNFQLLRDVAKETSSATEHANKPVLFKRGMAATINEWLCASEYITNKNPNVVLCERGLRTFEDATRFTLDISAVPVVQKQSTLPICVDVSHAAGRGDLVPSLACAAIAAGADAIMIEVHPTPKTAKSDGPQQLNLTQFSELISKLRDLAKALGKEIV